jgi:hypothetical protein
MKKFTELATGDSFEFQGEQYLKCGPLIARNLATNSQRMIPRSALVAPLAESTPEPVKKTQRELPEERVVEAFEHYHRGCEEWLQLTEEVDPELAARIREAMQVARQRFLAELSQL